MPDALLDIPTANIDTRKLTIRQRLGSEDLVTLMQSIERYGVIDPIVVRPTDGGRYELVIGQRRVEACLRLSMTTIPATFSVRAGRTSAAGALTIVPSWIHMSLTCPSTPCAGS